MCGKQDTPSGGCCCHTGRMRGFVQPRLLLHLAKKPAHGYELMDVLSQEGEDVALDAGTLYRTLRLMEEGGLVHSSWETGKSGPARRVYVLTDHGLAFLHAWAVTIRSNRAKLDRFLSVYEQQFHTQGEEAR